MLLNIFLLVLLSGFISAFNVLQMAQIAKIYPKKVISDIPSILSSKYLQMAIDDEKLTTSYTFPKEYKTTLYKDQEKKTTLINLFPTVETKIASVKYSTTTVMELITSTTLLYEHLNFTTEYQTTPMLNSTLLYPTTAPMQSIGYATVEYQHERLVYPTKINITQVTSTQIMNYTRVEDVDNNLPFV